MAVSTEPRFLKEFGGLPSDVRKRVIRAVGELQSQQMNDTKPLVGQKDIWRRRVGAYRLLLTRTAGWVHIYSVQHRQGVYAGRLATPREAPQGPAPSGFPTPWRPRSGGRSVEPSARPHPPVAAGEIAPWTSEELVGRGISPELATQIVGARDADDVEALIDLGLPENLFDVLVKLLQDDPSRQGDRRPSPPSNIELVKTRVIDAFFGRVLQNTVAEIKNLTIVTPWLTNCSGRTSSLDAVLRFVHKRRIQLNVVTRPPDRQIYAGPIERIKNLNTAEVSFIENLHAKFFLCELVPIPFALIGSANATNTSLTNYEIGVLVKGTGQAEGFVREVYGLADELRYIARVEKRRN